MNTGLKKITVFHKYIENLIQINHHIHLLQMVVVEHGDTTGKEQGKLPTGNVLESKHFQIHIAL